MAEGRPDWELSVETELVRCNLHSALRGDHPPRPLVPPIYNASTYQLENVKEGEVLSNTASKVTTPGDWKTECTQDLL